MVNMDFAVPPPPPAFALSLEIAKPTDGLGAGWMQGSGFSYRALHNAHVGAL